MKSRLRGYLFILFLGVLAGLLTLSLSGYFSKKKSILEVQNQIENLGRLVLLEQRYRSILTIENTQKILGFSLPSNKIILAVPYNVTYGVDLTKGVKIKQGISGLTVYHPDPEIFDIQAINPEIESFMTVGRIRIDDFLPVIEKNKEDLRGNLSEDYKQKVLQNLKLFFLTSLSDFADHSIQLKGGKS